MKTPIWRALATIGFLSLLSVSHAKPKTPKKGTRMIYIGTYTAGKSKGIYLVRMDMQTGRLTQPELVAEISNPSFLAIHPSQKYLYAVNENETFKGQKTGSVTAYAIDGETGKLALLNQQSSAGAGPCHISLDKTGNNALVANYSAGSVAVLPIQEDGHLLEASSVVKHTGSSVDKSRQEAPHAHSVWLSPDNRYALSVDLGVDKVFTYNFNSEAGTIKDSSSVSLTPGAGPRHLAFHPNGKYAYVINELNNTVTAMKYDAATGVLTPIESVSSLPQGHKETSYTSEILVHPNGKFLYGSNRIHDSIAIFSIDGATGKIKLLGTEPTQGKYPRNFNIDPTGAFMLVANQNGDNIVAYRINATTGALTPTGQTLLLEKPVCIKFFGTK